MLKTGSLFADKYGIIGHIGRGGMADVYKVQDIDTKQIVALKVLKAEFAKNRTFVRRFQQEGQAAAELDNANVVRIFDVGNEGDTYYIVMEYVDGITLKEYIRRKGMLKSRETMAIAAQAAIGLRSAHAHKIVHRDVKPQNIMLSKDGKVKVADFGIARAAHEETESLNANAMGSVFYLSPEQAKGQVCDDRSDIYSLGICMYEMITGRVPFDKETSVAVALAHMNEAIIPPSELNPDCPVALEQIIFRCTQKSRERRYHNCTELLQDLKTAVADPDHNFEIAEQETLRRSTTQIFTPEVTQEIREKTRTKRDENREVIRADETARSRVQSRSDETGRSREQSRSDETARSREQSRSAVSIIDRTEKPGRTAPAKQRTETSRKNLPQNSREADERAERIFREDKKADQKKTIDKILTVLEITIGGICLCMIVYLVSMLSGCVSSNNPTNPTTNRSSSQTETEDPEETASVATIAEKDFDPEKDTIVPDVKGMTVDEARAALEAANLEFHLSRTMEYRDDYDIGLIYQQSVDPDTMVAKGTAVYVWMSSGSDKFTIKDSYVGGDVHIFMTDIAMHKDQIDVIYEKVFDDTVATNQIISLTPSSGVLKSGDTIVVKYCCGPEYIPMPDLIGLTASEAYSIINAKGFDRGDVTYDYSDEYEAGIVIWQEYKVGARVYHGSDIDYTISSGPRMTTMPDVIGMTKEDALELLSDEDKYSFTINIVNQYVKEEELEEGQSFGMVVSTDPMPEEQVKVKGEITLTVLSSKTKEVIPDLISPDGEGHYRTLEEIVTELQRMSFVVETIYVGTMDADLEGPSWTYPEHGAEVEIGSTVQVYVYKYGVMPLLYGKTVDEAETILTTFGVTLDKVNFTYQETSDSSLDGKVYRSTPGTGLALPDTETKVTLTLYKYVAPPETQPESESEAESPSESSTESSTEAES